VVFAKQLLVTLSIQLANFPGRNHPPLVIPTEAKGSGPVVFAKQPLVTVSIQVANFPGSHHPPLVIPTGAKRSGGICSVPCGLIDLRLGMTNDRRGLL